jgi:predicted tellurium resistance membrane protein TerC
MLQDGVDLVGAPDGHYVMFKKEDFTAWITFTIVFTILIIFDNFILNRKHQRIGMLRAAVQTVFWMFTAGAFAVYIYYRNGHNAAFDWSSGYMLEWMLSFDNLFVFHMIFSTYATPDHLKHKPLFWGICGAVFFRLVFIFIGEYLMHAMWAAHLFFGGFLIYTGVQTVLTDEEDEDPTQNPFVQWLSSKVAFIPIYDKQGSFFVNVPCDEAGNCLVKLDDDGEYDNRETTEFESGSEQGGMSTRAPSSAEDSPVHSSSVSASSASSPDVPAASPSSGSVGYGAVSNDVEQGDRVVIERGTSFLEQAAAHPEFHHYEKRATMLFLVVCCLEISDILFAVDSVSAIVAQVSDLFLAYTSAVFAMLGLRSTFFIIDVLVKIFSLLKYGVALVLVFIGIKLCISKVYHIPPMLVCAILFVTLATSMILSVVLDKMGLMPDEEGDEKESNASDTEKPTMKGKQPEEEEALILAEPAKV